MKIRLKVISISFRDLGVNWPIMDTSGCAKVSIRSINSHWYFGMCYYSCDVTEKPADNEYMFKLMSICLSYRRWRLKLSEFQYLFFKDVVIIFSLEKYIGVDDISTIHKIVN